MDPVNPDMTSSNLEVKILLLDVINHRHKMIRCKTSQDVLDADVTHVTRQRELVKRLKSYFKKSSMSRWLTK